MKNFKKIAVVSVLGLALASVSAFANPQVRGFGPEPMCPYMNNHYNRMDHHGMHRANGYGLSRHGHHRYMMEYLMQDERYANDVTAILTLEDTLFGERQVLRALTQSADPSVREIRNQAKNVRTIENKLDEMRIALHQKIVKDNPDFLRDGIPCPYLDRLDVAPQAPEAPQAK